MKSARTTKAKEREVARIIPAFHGDQTDRLSHIAVDDVDDALSQFLARLPSLDPLQVPENGVNALQLELHCTAQKKPWEQPVKNDIRIRYRQPITFAITNRARICSSAFGS